MMTTNLNPVAPPQFWRKEGGCDGAFINDFQDAINSWNAKVDRRTAQARGGEQIAECSGSQGVSGFKHGAIFLLTRDND